MHSLAIANELDDEEDIKPKAVDEAISSENLKGHKQDLTDSIAGSQWENVEIPQKRDFAGGVYNIFDLI
jgi:hypothetical protein